MKRLKQGLTIRGDSLYCPLALGLDTYYNCEADCVYCFCRQLNAVWGADFRPLDMEHFERELERGLKSSPHSKSPLSQALRQRKTLRLGNKSDPFQPAEGIHHCTRRALELLAPLNWEVKVETKYTHWLQECSDLLVRMKAVITISLSCGMERDWELLENKRVAPVQSRIEAARFFCAHGLQVGFIGEPFIPGWNTAQDFDAVLRRIKAAGVTRYNVYNLRLNAFVAKRLAQVPGLDIERVWTLNQDTAWRPQLLELLDIARRRGVKLGCPDFINSGQYQNPANTCCGVDVRNPTTFNFIKWKEQWMAGGGSFTLEDLDKSWDGVGDYELGRALWEGRGPTDLYSWGDFAAGAKPTNNRGRLGL